MKKLTLLSVLLLTVLTALGQPSPLNHNRWTTNSDATIISGSTLTNVPQAAVTGLVGAYQPATTTLSNFNTLGTNVFVSTNSFVTFTNLLGTAAFTASVAYQPASSTLTNFASLTRGTNSFLAAPTNLSKAQFPVFNGTSWTYQSIPAGTSVLTYDVSGSTGLSYASVVNPANLGTGSSLSSAILYRDGIWRVPAATTNGTNITIFAPTQFNTNVNAQVAIKDGASVTNLQASGTTAMSVATATSATIATITADTVTAATSVSTDLIETSEINGTTATITTVNASNIVATSADITTITGDTLEAATSVTTDDVEAATVNTASLITSQITLGGVSRTNWPSGGGGGSPWTETINAAGYSLTNIPSIRFNPAGTAVSLLTVGPTNVIFFRRSDSTNNSGTVYLGDATFGSAVSLQAKSTADGGYNPRFSMVFGSNDDETFRWREGVMETGPDASAAPILKHDGYARGNAAIPSQLVIRTNDLTAPAWEDPAVYTNDTVLVINGETNEIWHFEYGVFVDQSGSGSRVKLNATTAVDWINYTMSFADETAFDDYEKVFTGIDGEVAENTTGTVSVKIIGTVKFAATTTLRIQLAPNLNDTPCAIKAGSYLKRVKKF